MADLEKVVEKKIDISGLKNGLEVLTGRDYANAEKQARINGEAMPMIQYSSTFQAALAAKALNVSTAEVKDLPIAEYMSVTLQVSRFLFSDTLQEMGMES
ncbi:MAG: hypothetical protein SPE14_05780 [Anaerovibrio sp.]|nr:hypothetical protein [Veillonellaceae bacterium]MDY4485591.1 hypothetical protein [Anaerovibrio sp.]